MILGINTRAEVSVYEDTVNKGMSKGERFEVIEKYMADFSKTVKEIESKVSDGQKKIKDLSESINQINLKITKLEEKKVENTKAEEKIDPKKLSEDLDKVKLDLENFKKVEVGKMSKEIEGLTNVVKSIQLMMKAQSK
jgi:uncharacterized coiled-coil protein SlyX